MEGNLEPSFILRETENKEAVAGVSTKSDLEGTKGMHHHVMDRAGGKRRKWDFLLFEDVSNCFMRYA